jgi:hypothetical protein
MKNPLLLAIRAYQKTLSFDHGPLRFLYPHGYCRFHPTCSQYAYEAIEGHGTLNGIWYALRRILKCHPWRRPAVDPIPKKTS